MPANIPENFRGHVSQEEWDDLRDRQMEQIRSNTGGCRTIRVRISHFLLGLTQV